MSANRHQKGQALVLSLLFLALINLLLSGFFQISWAVGQKIRLQLSTDAALLSALNVEANALNTIALENRAILANDALAAQLNALVSESSFYRKLAEKFSRLLQFIPYAGVAANFLSRGIHIIEMLARRTASAVLPMARISNKTLEFSLESIRHLFPYQSLEAATRVLTANMPAARLHPAIQGEILRQAFSLQHALTDLDKENMEKMRIGTMDKHTRSRNWRVSVGGFSPVRKTGGTNLAQGRMTAYDKMKFKVFDDFRWKWKTVLTTKSDAGDFGYQSPENLLSLSHGGKKTKFDLAIVARATSAPPFGFFPSAERGLTAVSAGTLVFRRPSHPEEDPNILNPFWATRLIPVDSETTLGIIVPDLLLGEIRH